MAIDIHPVTRYIQHDRRGRRWVVLVEPIRIEISLGNASYIRLVVPAGTKTDYASTPRFFWRVLPSDGPYLAAAIVHDWLYRTECPRFLADCIFRELMAQTKSVKVWQRVLMYYAVRIFGKPAWKAAQKKRGAES